MKDFDQEIAERHAERAALMGERTFVLGGETFRYREAVSYTVLEGVAKSDELNGQFLIQALEDAVLDMLEPGQEDLFLSTVRSKEKPVTFADLNAICTWLTEAQVGRPTPASLPSGPGGEKTETSSTDDSSSKPAVASAA